MNYFLSCISLLILSFSSVVAMTDLPALSDKAAQLEFVSALPVEGPDKIAPSGLTLLNSSLYAVSENHPNTIFRVVFESRNVKFVADQTFNIPKKYKKLKLTGITVDGYGQFYVLCGHYGKVFRVHESNLEEIPLKDLPKNAVKKGFFRKIKSGPTGLVLLQPNLFAVSTERAPRSIIVADYTKSSVHKVPNLIFSYKEDRYPDLSGLYYYNAQLWGLARNAESIIRLVYRDGIYVEDFAYSYGHATFNQLYQYRNMRLGMAEGFAMNKNYIYMISNNKKHSRMISKDDKRPLLFIFKNPLPTQKI